MQLRSLCFTAACAFLVLGTAVSAEMIHLMARKGDVAKVQAEIDKGVPVDLPSTTGARIKGSSPLVVAARFGRTNVVLALLERGADPSYTVPDAETEFNYSYPLHVASSNGHADIVRILLDAGVDASFVDPWIGTALHLARVRGHKVIEDMLIASGVPDGRSYPSVSHLLASADIERGRLLAGACRQCHHMEAQPTQDQKDGPPLWDVLGREVGSSEDFEYTPTLANRGGHWDFDTLNSFIASPRVSIPGNRMDIDGIAVEQDRVDMIAYIRTLSDSPIPLP